MTFDRTRKKPWPLVTLGEVFEPVTRRNRDGVDLVLTASGEHGLVAQTDFFSRSVAGASLKDYYLLRRGEFAYNRSLMEGYPYGAIKRLDQYDEGVLSTLYLCFALRRRDCDSDFYRHYFESGLLNTQLRTIARMGARAHGLLNVSNSDFFNLKIPLPGGPEQKRTASVLNEIESAISATRAVVQQLQKSRNAIVQDLLSKGVPNWHTVLRQDPHVGLIPANWSVHALAELSTSPDGICYGVVQPGEEWPKGVPLIRVCDIEHQDFDATKLKRINPKVASAYRRSILEGGELLVTLVGTIGRCMIVPDSARGFNIARAVAKVPLKGTVNARFIMHVLNSVANKALQGGAFESARKTLNLAELARIRIPVPGKSEQDEISKIIDCVDQRLCLESKKHDQLVALKKALGDRLLAGSADALLTNGPVA